MTLLIPNVCLPLCLLASIRAPALMQKLRSKYCPQQQNIDAFLNLMKKRLTDAQNQLDQAAVAKHYQNASRRVKSSVRFALMRLSELKVQASVSLTRTISKIDKKQKLAKIYGSACESALTMGSLMRKRFDANKYRAFLSLRSALLRLDANIKSKVGLVTLEQYVQKSICEKEADAAKLRKYAVVQSCVSGITRSETGYSLLCLGILAAVGTGARIIMRSHQRR